MSFDSSNSNVLSDTWPWSVFLPKETGAVEKQTKAETAPPPLASWLPSSVGR